MKVILLAAGRGSRLGERTREKPKCLCELFGQTLLARAVASIEGAGFARSEIGIVTGYRRDMIAVEGVAYFHNADWADTNMVRSLTMARDWLRQETCLVCYTDIVFSSRALRQLADCPADVAVTYYSGFWDLWQRRMDNPLEDLETFRLDQAGRLLEIGEKPKSREEIEGQYMGMVRFTPAGWAQAEAAMETPLEKTLDKLDMTTLLRGMLRRGCAIDAVRTDDLWLECDTQEDIACYEREYAGQL